MTWRLASVYDDEEDGFVPRLSDKEVLAATAADTSRKAEICPYCGGSLSISADRYCDGYQCQAE